MAVKALYLLMNLALRNLKVVFVPGEKEERKSMAKDQGNGEKEKI
ncbi:hypothetical protein QUB47_21850 [Microcoleus sp. AT9_B5]